ncbi:MAG: hypothetical protein AAFZ15_30780 [Bacteroidota bacterium]
MRFPCILAILLTSILCYSEALSQEIDTTHQIRKVDFRGKGPDKAVVAALSASKEDVIVIVVRGGSTDLVENTENDIRTLINNGYDRIGLIHSDPFPDDQKGVIGIFSQGSTYAVLEDDGPDTFYDWAFYNLVIRAYEDDILSKVKGNRIGKN